MAQHFARHNFWGRSWSVLYWLPTGVFLSHYFYNIKTVSGRSMQPTLNPNSSPSRDVAIFSRFDVQRCGREDIVTLCSPEDPNRTLIKRIVAVEGDVVQTLPPYPDKEVIVPPGYVWVEGDEPFFSDDSNRFGPVPQGLIRSKLVMLVWPPERFGPVKSREIPKNSYRQINRLALSQLEKEKARRSRVEVQIRES
ncbi:peptidase S24/S26A/S26B/S26C [Crassisporium funariophilum]|nr:peptidase S24/S26A/S26B/S26C [Crassisporium funariophilum]